MHDIVIIGSGVIGLTTAVVIQEQLKSIAKVTIYTEKLSPHTTSDIAAGLWGLYLVQDPDTKKILNWGKQTHDLFFELWKSGYANEAGLSLQLVKSLDAEDDSASGDGIVFGKYPMRPNQLEQLNKQLTKNYKSGYTYVTFTCEPTKFLPFLYKKFVEHGGCLKIRKINSFEELAHCDVIINCTGLNALELTGDQEMSPIRGQVARVAAPWQFHTILSLGTYVISNSDFVVLGGTSQMHDYDTCHREADKEMILKGCCALIPALKNASVITDVVGLRPGRSQIRVELEVRSICDKQIPVIHNYGHGGAGVTLSHGCALSTAELVKNALNIPNKSKL